MEGSDSARVEELSLTRNGDATSMVDRAHPRFSAQVRHAKLKCGYDCGKQSFESLPEIYSSLEFEDLLRSCYICVPVIAEIPRGLTRPGNDCRSREAKGLRY